MAQAGLPISPAFSRLCDRSALTSLVHAWGSQARRTGSSWRWYLCLAALPICKADVGEAGAQLSLVPTWGAYRAGWEKRQQIHYLCIYWTGLARVINAKKPPNALKSSRSQDPWICRISPCQPLQGLDSTRALLRFQVGNKWRPLLSPVLPAPFPAGVTRKDRTPRTFLPVDSSRKATPSSFSALWEKPWSLPTARPKYCLSQVVRRRILNACIHKLSVADFFCTTPQSFTMLAGCGPDEKYFQDLPKLHSSYSCFICPKQFSQMTLDGKCFNGL